MMQRCRWRTGRETGRAIYAQDAGEDGGDLYLGMMESVELAAEVCRLVNTAYDLVEPYDPGGPVMPVDSEH